MKELIYVHVGTSHTASHLFNAQQSNFTYGDRDDSVLIDHDISFHGSKASDDSTKYCPRLLLFDFKANFGSIASVKAPLEDNGEDDTPDMWPGKVDEHRQVPIPPSKYHLQLNDGTDDAPDDSTDDLTLSVRFWSDYSGVFFHPRGLHAVPDVAEWERRIGWTQGAERFALYDEEHSVMDDSFRLLAEECDLLQGVQLTLDAPSFGSFTVPLLAQLRDEYPKLPLLSFCTLSPANADTVDLENNPACLSAINDALTLHELATFANIVVPLQHPTTWYRGQWSSHLDADFTNAYHSSALLAAHLDSATLPLRLEQSISSSTDLATVCAHLNWRNDTPFVALSGAFPLSRYLTQHDEQYTYDFSHPQSIHEKYKSQTVVPFAQRDIYRGLNSLEHGNVQKLLEDDTQLRLRAPLLVSSCIDVPYLIPSSHPQFFTRLDSTGRDMLGDSRVRVRSVPIYTSLQTTPRTGALAQGYAHLLDRALRRRLRVLDELGTDHEAVGEAMEGWWRWTSAYGPHEEEEAWGEDERDL